MKISSIVPMLVFGASLAISANCLAEEAAGEAKECPSKDVCMDCMKRCKTNPMQCPEDCQQCKGCKDELHRKMM
ncbi:MAG: hypothetical protein P1U74_09765 [Legionellaceae bacterium]|nr:hypothetical protein [Legionellaceae bacterium]